MTRMFWPAPEIRWLDEVAVLCPPSKSEGVKPPGERESTRSLGFTLSSC